VAQDEMIRKPHGCAYEADSLLECDAVYFVKSLTDFGSSAITPFSE